MILIQLQNIFKIYTLGHNQIAALSNVSLDISAGEFVAIWGPSGSGKTTLLNIIGLIDEPTQGKMYLQNQSVDALNDNTKSEIRNDNIGFIFQNFNLVPVLNALENVMLPLQIRGENFKHIRKQAEYRLDQVGLADHLLQKPDQLSGGQKQRVAIARALISSPKLIIADEPTANLDTKTAENMILEMNNINKDEGTTFIFSTHDSRLLKHVTRKILLSDGQIINNQASE